MIPTFPEFIPAAAAHALKAVDPYQLILNHVKVEAEKNLLHIKDKTFDLKQLDKIHVLGAGKGAAALFKGMETVMADRIHGGVIVSVEDHAFSHAAVTFYPGSHPIPGPQSLAAGQAMMAYIKNNVGAEDLVFFLLTGGASSLLAAPASPLELADKIEITRLLLGSGADIYEINCVRKLLSALKGGRLAKMVSPTRLFSLILSDIIDSPLEDIGSGPSVGDSTSFADAAAVLHKYRLMGKIPLRVRDYLGKGVEKKVADTPSPDAEIFSQNSHFLLADNLTALTAAKESAEASGVPAYIMTSRDCGEASEAAKVYAAVMKEIIRSGNPFPPPVLLLSGGELTVTLKGKGKGGRNQEFVLAMLAQLKNVHHPFYILSMGTDGIDGPTDAAGAWIDHHTMAKVRKQKLDIKTYLNDNNAYEFFRKIDQLLRTGPTGTNVMDMRMFYLPPGRLLNGSRR